MDFELDDDQLALRDGARELLDGMADPAHVRLVVERGGGIDGDLWAAMIEQGWPGIAVREELGGLGLGWVEVTVLAEEIGRHVAPAPFLTTVLALDAFGAAGDREMVEALLAGERTACIAWSASHDAVRAELDAGVWRLSGRPDPTPYAPSADVALVVAAARDGAALFAVDVAEAGRPDAESVLDQTRELGWLHLDGTPAVRVGDAAACDALLDRGATGTSAEMLGASARVLEMSVDYAKDRVQFGRPIGSFQAVKHRCADMLVDVEGMRSTAYWAGWCLGADDPDSSVAASTAKIWCSDAATRVTASGLQVHGGIGFTWEHDLHLFLKRARVDAMGFGDAPYHRRRLTTLLRPRILAGESVI